MKSFQKFLYFIKKIQESKKGHMQVALVKLTNKTSQSSSEESIEAITTETVIAELETYK